MSVAKLFDAALGEWTGTNKLRTMSDDEYDTSTSTASICAASRGKVAVIAYTWANEGTDQDGLLVLGEGRQEGTVTAIWCDSWHQSPYWMELEGSLDASGAVVVRGNYGENADWRIRVDPGDGTELRLAMDNLIPEADYQVVEAVFTRR